MFILRTLGHFTNIAHLICLYIDFDVALMIAKVYAQVLDKNLSLVQLVLVQFPNAKKKGPGIQIFLHVPLQAINNDF